MGAEAVAPLGWAGAGELLGGASLGEATAGVGTFLVSNLIGWGILATAAVGGIGYLGYKAYQNAHSQSQAKFQQKVISQAVPLVIIAMTCETKLTSLSKRWTTVTMRCWRTSMIYTRPVLVVYLESPVWEHGAAINSNS